MATFINLEELSFFRALIALGEINEYVLDQKETMLLRTWLNDHPDAEALAIHFDDGGILTGFSEYCIS